MRKQKTARLDLRVQPGQKLKIERAAKKCGLTLSEYVLQCCSKNAPREKPPEEFWQLLDQLYSIYDGLPIEKQNQLASLILSLQEVI